LLGHRMYVCSCLVDTVKYFCKVVYFLFFLQSNLPQIVFNE
jgi:hypothetical protein